MAEFESIVDQVVKYLLDFAHVGGDVELFTGQDQVERDPALLAGPLESLDGPAYGVIDVKICDIKHYTVGAKTIELQKICGELVQTFRLKKNNI